MSHVRTDPSPDQKGRKPRERRPRRRVVTLVLLVVAVVAAVAVLAGLDWLAEPGSSSGASLTEPGEPVADEFQGDESGQTQMFEVGENWEIRWRAEPGASFSAELFTSDGVSRGVVVEAGGVEEGGTFISESGSFYLEVDSLENWAVSIVDRSAADAGS